MPKTVVPREIGMGRVAHPDPMRGPGYMLDLIDDPRLDRLYDGDATFGWEGDNRVAVYLNRQWLRWELWRLESDNTYRYQHSWPLATVRAEDLVATVILHCVQSDTHRGFDPHLFTVERTRKNRSKINDRLEDAVNEGIDRVAHALHKALK